MTKKQDIEMSQQVTVEYCMKNSQISGRNLYDELCQCLNHIAAQNAEIARLLEVVSRLLVCMQLANWENDDAAIFARAALTTKGTT